MAHFSLMWLLQNELIQVIPLRNKASTPGVTTVPLFSVESPERLKFLSLKRMPLGKFKQPRQVLYISAVPLKLANRYDQPAIEIASMMAKALYTSITANDTAANPRPADWINPVRPHLEAQAFPPGWLHLTVTAPGIGQWLQCINEALPEAMGAAHQGRNQANEQTPAGRTRGMSRAEALFSIQHAHARCCSLLGLAHQAKFITLQAPQPATSPFDWRIIQPTPLPWIDRAGNLCLQEPAEWRLLDQLAESADLWEQGQSRRRSPCLLAQAVDLSQAFQGFHRHCRVWGEDRLQYSNLIQVRLGLIRATQAILYLFLTKGLEEAAPFYL